MSHTRWSRTPIFGKKFRDEIWDGNNPNFSGYGHWRINALNHSSISIFLSLEAYKKRSFHGERGGNSCGWIVSLLWWIEKWGWRKGRSKSDYVKPLYVSFLIINEKTYDFPLNFVSECLSAFHSNLCYFELFDLVKGLCCFFVIAGSNLWSEGHLRRMKGASRNEHNTRKWRIEVSPTSPFYNPI